MHDLENLRKQAKRYLRWHRDGRHPVAALIRSVLPQFRSMSDGQIMAYPFKLAHAQNLAARRAGYETWQALKEGCEPMPSVPAAYPARPVVTTAEPQIFVTDMARALRFYTETLGFSIGFTYGEPPFYAQVVRDAAMLNLRLVSKPALDRTAGKDLLSAAFGVTNARALFSEFQLKEVTFHQSLTKEPWHGQGQGAFIVTDPDGNLLVFGGRTD